MQQERNLDYSEHTIHSPKRCARARLKRSRLSSMHDSISRSQTQSADLLASKTSEKALAFICYTEKRCHLGKKTTQQKPLPDKRERAFLRTLQIGMIFLMP